MKKMMMMIAALAMTVAMQAQSKFHDVEANHAKGPVKTMTVEDMMGQQVTNFSEDGKMQSREMTDVVYDKDGYIQSAKVNAMGQSATAKFVWENGILSSRVIEVNGQSIKTKYVYDDNGVVTSEKIDLGEHEIEFPYSDYKFDDHGNWISRKASAMGREMITTRSFIYY